MFKINTNLYLLSNLLLKILFSKISTQMWIKATKSHHMIDLIKILLIFHSNLNIQYLLIIINL